MGSGGYCCGQCRGTGGNYCGSAVGLVPIESPCHSSGLGCEVGGSGVEGGSTKECVCELQDSVRAEL